VFWRRRSKSMEKAKIWPLPHQNPLTDLHRNWQAWLRTSWTAPGMQNFVAIGSGVSAPQIRDFAVPLGWLVFLRFLGSSIRLQPTPLDGFLRKIRQMTSFWVRKCLLGFRWLYFIFRPLKFSKNRHFGDRFWLDLSFLRPKIALTWGYSNIKLP